MKAIAIVLAAVLASGCAASGALNAEPPHYDYAQQALIGKRYPVERVAIPPGFEFADVYVDERRERHSFAGDPRSVRVVRSGVAWSSDEGNTSVATALHRGVPRGSRWNAWNDADGYEFVGNHRVQYATYTGGYGDVSGDAGSIPEGAPECAASSHLVVSSARRSKQTILTYTEGMACDRLAAFGDQDAENQRQRAYQAFGIR